MTTQFGKIYPSSIIQKQVAAANNLMKNPFSKAKLNEAQENVGSKTVERSSNRGTSL